MRSAGNFSPEWGYLAPAPSFLRTVRVVVVATAIGATAGAGVVLSLVEHPAPEVGTAAVGAHAIVTSAQAATGPGETATRMPAQPRPVIATQSPQIPAPQVSAPQIPAVSSQSVSPSATSAAPAPQSGPGVAALTEGTPSNDAAPAETPDQASVAPVEELPQKKSAAKHAWPPYPANAKNKPTSGIGTVLRHLFTAHAGASYYPNR